jgi:hypothetical protein
LRLGDRLKIEWHIEDDVDRDAKVPVLILRRWWETRYTMVSSLCLRAAW